MEWDGSARTFQDELRLGAYDRGITIVGGILGLPLLVLAACVVGCIALRVMCTDRPPAPEEMK